MRLVKPSTDQNMPTKLSAAATFVFLTFSAAGAQASTILCCQSVVSSNSPQAMTIAHLLGINLDGLNINVGLTCAPLTLPGSECFAVVVNCDDPQPQWNGLIALNCKTVL
ncbi:hypothetical protein B0H19DRAFT_1249228 [Mycena capillaripes]|nr:hypothetical protein B0H19DRAFT_1249228 [Mycena capillaripes]